MPLTTLTTLFSVGRIAISAIRNNDLDAEIIQIINDWSIQATGKLFSSVIDSSELQINPHFSTGGKGWHFSLKYFTGNKPGCPTIWVNHRPSGQCAKFGLSPALTQPLLVELRSPEIPVFTTGDRYQHQSGNIYTAIKSVRLPSSTGLLYVEQSKALDIITGLYVKNALYNKERAVLFRMNGDVEYFQIFQFDNEFVAKPCNRGEAAEQWNLTKIWVRDIYDFFNKNPPKFQKL